MQARFLKILYFIPSLVLIFLLLFFWSSSYHYKMRLAQKSTLPSGQPLPPFALPELNFPEKRITNLHLKGRLQLLNIWSSHCAACQLEQPILMEIKEQYHIPIYGLNVLEEETAVTAWLKKAGNPYIAVALDRTGITANLFALEGIPTTIVVDDQGRMIYRYVGALNQSVLESVLLPLMALYVQE